MAILDYDFFIMVIVVNHSDLLPFSIMDFQNLWWRRLLESYSLKIRILLQMLSDLSVFSRCFFDYKSQFKGCLK